MRKAWLPSSGECDPGRMKMRGETEPPTIQSLFMYAAAEVTQARDNIDGVGIYCGRVGYVIDCGDHQDGPYNP